MERVVLTLRDGLAKRHIRCPVFCTDAPGAWFDRVPAGERACVPRRPGFLGVDPATVLALARFIRQQMAQAVHAHNLLAQCYAVLASCFAQRPVLVTLHGEGYFDTTRRVGLRRLLRYRTWRAITVTTSIHERLQRLGALPWGRSAVIANGIPTSEYERVRTGSFRKILRARYGIPERAFVVGSVGRLAPEKNYSLLLQAVASLRASASDPDDAPFLVLVGDGLERPRLEAQTHQLGLDLCVRFAGFQADVASWLGCLDVFCLPSLTEGLPLTLLEAGAASLPLVATDVGGNREIVQEGVNGFLVASGDTAGLTNALNRLRNDPSLRIRMGQQAQEIVARQYAADAMLDRYEALYQELLRPGL